MSDYKKIIKERDITSLGEALMRDGLLPVLDRLWYEVCYHNRSLDDRASLQAWENMLLALNARG